MAEIKIAEIDTLEKKSKNDFKLLFLMMEFFIILILRDVSSINKTLLNKCDFIKEN